MHDILKNTTFDVFFLIKIFLLINQTDYSVLPKYFVWSDQIWSLFLLLPQLLSYSMLFFYSLSIAK